MKEPPRVTFFHAPLVEEFEQSGTSAKRIAALLVVNCQTFASRVQTRHGARGRSVQDAVCG